MIAIVCHQKHKNKPELQRRERHRRHTHTKHMHIWRDKSPTRARAAKDNDCLFNKPWRGIHGGSCHQKQMKTNQKGSEPNTTGSTHTKNPYTFNWCNNTPTGAGVADDSDCLLWQTLVGYSPWKLPPETWKQLRNTANRTPQESQKDTCTTGATNLQSEQKQPMIMTVCCDKPWRGIHRGSCRQKHENNQEIQRTEYHRRHKKTHAQLAQQISNRSRSSRW